MIDILMGFVVLAFATNIIIPFVLDGSANKWANGIGWGMAILYFLMWRYGG